MNCKNCGTALMGMEHACPVCGAPVPQMPQQPVQNPVAAPDAYQAGLPQMPQTTMMSPATTPGAMPEPVSEPVAEKPKKDNKIFGILLIIVAFAAIGVGVFLMMTEEKTTPVPVQQEQTQQEQVVTANYVEFGGFNFEVPAEYTSEVNDKVLTIQNENVIYTIQVDYTNSYDTYKTAFINAYPAQAASIVTNVGDREYVAAIITDQADQVSTGTEYMTNMENITIVGWVVRSDYTPATTDEFDGLNEILASASLVGDIAEGTSDQDSGVSGIVAPSFNKANFVFE